MNFGSQTLAAYHLIFTKKFKLSMKIGQKYLNNLKR